MKFISYDEIEKFLLNHDIRWILQNYGRYRIAPGFTVADYVKIREFFRTAHQRRMLNLVTGLL